MRIVKIKDSQFILRVFCLLYLRDYYACSSANSSLSNPEAA